MSERASIRLILGTFVVARGATLLRGLRVPAGRDLVVGMGARILGPIEAGGHVHLARNVMVVGNVRAALDVVVGAEARIVGDVKAGADALVLEGAKIAGTVGAQRHVRIFGASIAGAVEALGDVEVRGEALLREVAAGGRLRTLRAWPEILEFSPVRNPRPSE